MDIKYEIEPVFKIEFFKIKCIDFKNKKKKLEKALARYPEMPQANFKSNRDGYPSVSHIGRKHNGLYEK